MVKSYEQLRLNKLAEANILDTLPEKEFDDIVKLCTQICETPVALVSLVDEKRQWFKACVGLGEVRETPRDIAFCDHTVRLRDTLVVEDTTLDPRFMNHPFVTGEPNVRFYAGAPLKTSDGYCIGTLCLVDVKPRQLTQTQRESLEVLSRQVMMMIESRTLKAEAQLDQLQAKNAQQRLQDATRSIVAGVFHIDKTGRCTFANEGWGRIMGVPSEKLLGYSYMSFIVEDDRILCFERLMKAREQKANFKETARIRRPDGTIRYVECNSAPGRDGSRVGTAYDVTDYVERIRTLEKELIHSAEPVLKKAE